ncbi:MAG: response regulator, partial [Deltaproteobacteria bacterium]|nr:response regulator [Deltaproteobacteria bacterium]
PKMDGYQVCRFLKFDENYQHIPVILLTARGQERDKVVGKEVGADDYITKPFDNQLLLSKIQKFIGAL